LALTPGTRLGPYEIVTPIGAGGMGEVYRATDSNLKRAVAIKVLPASVAGDADRLARFQREAEVLAALNHPNIAAIYGLEKTQDLTALVMELVEGEDLSDHIARGPIPLAEAQPIARQIADALEAAHEQGIIHRDLKPANIKVRADGTVKILDFGLAKALDPAASSSGEAMNSPTMTARATQIGMILGTAAYMAPEQAKGKTVDRRADIWAFGVVLFEMLTGRRAFEGEDISEVLAGVLKLDPDWSALPADLPEPVRRLLKRCLEKDPKKRLRDIAEGMLQLEDALATPVVPAAVVNAPAPAIAPVPFWRRALPVIVTAIISVAAVVAVQQWRLVPAAPRTPVHFTYDTGQAPLAHLVNDRGLSISPDGTVIVFVAAQTNSSDVALWTRRLDQLEASSLRGGASGENPVVSPDNAWVAFTDRADGRVLKKVSILGGPATVVGRTPDAIAGEAWTADGAIVFGGATSGLMTVPDGGGTPAALTQLEKGEAAHRWPSVVPGTSILLFAIGVGSDYQLAAIDRASGRLVRFKVQGTQPRYAPTGHIVYAQGDGALRAVAFDPKTLSVMGNPVPVVEGVTVRGSGSADFDLALDGRLIYASGAAGDAKRLLVWTDRSGAETPIAAPVRAYNYATLSPDGTRVSLDIRDAAQTVWVWDLKHESLVRLTSADRTSSYGVWSTDSQSVFVQSPLDGRAELYRIRADATGQPELLTDPASKHGVVYPNAATPDGKQLVFRIVPQSGAKNDLDAVSLTDHAVHPVLATEHDELNATLSPDGKWMAFESDLSGRKEIYVRPFPDTSASQFALSTSGGIKPRWSPTGREIFYLSPDNKLIAVPVDTSKGFTSSKPVPLFDTRSYYDGAVGRNYDVSLDGKRFLMIKETETGGVQTPITIVIDWAEELRAKFKKQ
jgi:serine/threonine-protein kinase